MNPPSSPEEPRSGRWGKLRGMIKDKDLKLPFKKAPERSNDDDLNAFFGRSSADVVPAEKPSVPRIDTTTGPPAWATRSEDLHAGKWRPTKPLRRQGLYVGFSDAAPEVIGEGGDDAEDPVASISHTRAGAPAPYYSSRHASDSTEVSALKRKATTAHHLQPPDGRPDPLRAAPEAETRKPTLPDLSSLELQPRVQPSVDPPSTSTQQQQDHRLPVRSRRPTVGREPEDSSGNHTPVNSGQGSHKMFEMHAAEGMAHRHSIRSATEVQDALQGRHPSESVLSLGAGTGHMISSAAEISSPESSRPASKHSRYSASPEPTAAAAAGYGYPLAPSLSASSAHLHLSPPASSHGARGYTAPTKPVGPSDIGRSTSVLRDVAPAPYQDVPPALAPQPGAARLQEVDPPAIVASATATTGTVAPKPRRPSNVEELERLQNMPRQPPPAPLASTNKQAVPEPLQSPPYTSSVSPPSHHLPQMQSFQSAVGTVHRRPSVGSEESLALFSEFASSVSNMFTLSATADGANHSTSDWLFAALWWFLKARARLEDVARETSTRQQLDVGSLSQSHLNLAKSWWITSQVLPARQDPSADAQVVRATTSTLTSSIQSLCASLTKRDILPTRQSALAQGLDSSIWTKRALDTYPSEWTWVLSGAAFATGQGRPSRPLPLAALPLSDSSSGYCYGRIFAQASVASGDDDPTLAPFECVVSVVRKIGSPEMEAVICSQDATAAVFVRTAEEAGVHWEHSRFEHEIHCMRIKLPHKVRLWVHCSPRDYAWLWACLDNSQKIARTMKPHTDEIHMATLNLASFQYRDSSRPDDFPAEPVNGCRLAVFERFASPEDHFKRKTHRGYRMAVMTTSKVIRNVTIALGNKAPLEYAQSGSSPEFRLQIKEMDRGRSAHLRFHDIPQRDHFRDLITGTSMRQTEESLWTIPLRSVTAGAVTQGVTPEQWPQLNFSVLQVIDEIQPDDLHREMSTFDLSANIRVMMFNKQGSLVDRVCDASLSVRIRLDAKRPETLQVMRPGPREDMTLALGPETGGEPSLRHVFDTVTSVPSAIAYGFNSIKEMHAFELALTGHKVLYDGVVSAFTVTRRRMYVGKDKNWDALKPRLQIVERDGRHQMLVFFEGFIVADCLKFEVKRTDVYEQISGHKNTGFGMFGIKLVDAKFTLPGSNKDDWLREGAQRDAVAKYVNLATDEYAAEHEDILIWFDTEQGEASVELSNSSSRLNNCPSRARAAWRCASSARDEGTQVYADETDLERHCTCIYEQRTRDVHGPFFSSALVHAALVTVFQAESGWTLPKVQRSGPLANRGSLQTGVHATGAFKSRVPSDEHVSSVHHVLNKTSRSVRSLASRRPSSVFIIPSSFSNLSPKCAIESSIELLVVHPFPSARSFAARVAPYVKHRPMPTAPIASSRSASCTTPSSGCSASTAATLAGSRCSCEKETCETTRCTVFARLASAPASSRNADTGCAGLLASVYFASPTSWSSAASVTISSFRGTGLARARRRARACTRSMCRKS